MPDSIAAYASPEDFAAYVEGWETDDEEALKRCLHRASRDIDRNVGPGWTFEDNGLKFGDLSGNPKGLEPHQIEALIAATCAQAEYRITMGEDWFVQDQYKQSSGPDFSTSGKLSRFAPKAREELLHSDLIRATGGRLVR